MKAVIYNKKSKTDFMTLQEVDKPIPKDHEVLVKVYSVSVNAADYRSMKMGLIPKSKIFGADIAGKVEYVGKDVKRFNIGDAVVGDISANGFGGFAEYAVASESALVLKPETITFEVAASVPMASVTALQGLIKGNIQPNQKVLICGSGGGVGTFAVQLTKHFKAEVTAVCGSKNTKVMHDLGVEYVIDYHQKDFTQSNKRYDLILAVNGNYSLSAYKRTLTTQGTVVIVGGSLSQLFKSMIFGKLLFLGSKKMRVLAAKPNVEDLQYIINLVQNGDIKPVIHRCYSLDETAEAVEYLSAGHAKGKVIIQVAK